MSPLEGITCLKADITHPSTIPLLLNALDADFIPGSTSIEAAQPVDLVISDGAPDVTGLHDLDIYIQSQLLWAALNLALCVLKPGGKFVAKIFRGKDVDLLYAQMKVLFEHVTVAKPRSSRASSVEAFIVCINFQPPQGFKASLENPLGAGRIIKPSSGARKQNAGVSRKLREDGVTELDLGSDTENENEGNRWIAPFLACGDLSAFDADASHKLPAGHVSLDPVQPPTAPPYKRALEERKKMGGAYGKTKPELVKWSTTGGVQDAGREMYMSNANKVQLWLSKPPNRLDRHYGKTVFGNGRDQRLVSGCALALTNVLAPISPATS
jgi:tRNA (cytidine32/guanosine34-2'-O)-methyltransferase